MKQKEHVLVRAHWFWWLCRSHSRRRRRWLLSWMSDISTPFHTEVEFLCAFCQRGGLCRYCTVVLGWLKQHLAQQPVRTESGFLCCQVGGEPLGVPWLELCSLPMKHFVIHLPCVWYEGVWMCVWCVTMGLLGILQQAQELKCVHIPMIFRLYHVVYQECVYYSSSCVPMTSKGKKRTPLLTKLTLIRALDTRRHGLCWHSANIQRLHLGGRCWHNKHNIGIR